MSSYPIITKYNNKSKEGYNLHFDTVRIEQARKEFKNRDFKKCLEIYKIVEQKTITNDLDKKIIEFCEQHH